MDAHSKLEIVLNEDEENEEEKRFNEIICYDSGVSDGESNEFERCDKTATDVDISSESYPNTQDVLNTPGFEIETNKSEKRSNAVQMRIYRAKQRRDPERYRQYLERERLRNYKRKYERRVQLAQEKAQALGIPYVVVEAPNARRGRKSKDAGMSLVLPTNYDSFDIEDKSLWIDADEQPIVEEKVESKQSSDSSTKQNPQISVVSIDKLIAHPRSALQTLLPQEVNGRERLSNSIKLEHDYVMQEQLSMRKKGKRFRNGKLEPDELLKIQEQCRNYILESVSDVRKKRTRRYEQRRRNERQYERIQQNQSNKQNKRNRNEPVEHEDLDDLFKELAEVADLKHPNKSCTSSSSPHKYSPGQHTNRKKGFYDEVEPQSAGEFSLTVSMPVKPVSKLKSLKLKEKPRCPPTSWNDRERDKCKRGNVPMDDYTLRKSDRYNIRNSVEIKSEPIHSDDDFF